MDDFNIIKNTLSFFNYNLVQEDFDNDENKNIKVCKLKLQQAIRKVQQEHSWSFLLQPIPLTLDETLQFKMGFSAAYKLPSGLIRISTVFCEKYRRAGNYILCDELPEVWGMTETLPEVIQTDFYDLVSTALAIIVLPTIMPDSEILSTIIQQYQWQLQAMIKSDLNNSFK